MLIKKLKLKIKKNIEILALASLILITIIFTSYYNFNKKKIFYSYTDLLENIYFKKSFNQILDNLEPRFKKINHKISPGETFNRILEGYSINQLEIQEIKKKISKKINLNKLNTNQKIYFTVDQTNDIIKEFTFQISNTEKIYLKRNTETDELDQKIVLTKLKKKVIYKENLIMQSLYKSAQDKKVPINTIIEWYVLYRL